MDDSTISAPGCEQHGAPQHGIPAANTANEHKSSCAGMDVPGAAEMDSRSILCEGFGAISRIAVDMPGLSLASRALYAYLCAHANGSHRSWPSTKRIVETLGVSENTFYRARGELAERGLVSWEVRSTAKGRRTVYVMNQLVSDLRGPREKISTEVAVEEKFSTIPRSEPYLKNCGMAPIPQNLRYAIKNKYVNLNKNPEEKNPAAAQAGRAEALDGGGGRPLEGIGMEGFEEMERTAPRPTRPSSAPKAARAFSALVESGEEPGTILAAWRAYAAWQRDKGDPKRAMTVLSFLTKPTGYPRWRRDGAAERQAEPVPAADGKPSPSPEPPEPEGYAEVLRAFPKSPRGGAKAQARRAYAELVAEGASPAELLAAARAYAEKVRAEGREFRYVMSLATFLSEPKGARSWLAASAEAGRERERSRRARRAGEVSAALGEDDEARERLALAYADRAGGSLAAQAARVRADGSDGRVRARDSFMALERMLASADHRAGWVDWAHAELFPEGDR